MTITMENAQDYTCANSDFSDPPENITLFHQYDEDGTPYLRLAFLNKIVRTQAIHRYQEAGILNIRHFTEITREQLDNIPGVSAETNDHVVRHLTYYRIHLKKLADCIPNHDTEYCLDWATKS